MAKKKKKKSKEKKANMAIKMIKGERLDMRSSKMEKRGNHVANCR